jgi:hypothetical protein
VSVTTDGEYVANTTQCNRLLDRIEHDIPSAEYVRSII